MVRLDLLPYGRHAHLEQSLNFRIASDAISFWKAVNESLVLAQSGQHMGDFSVS